MDKGQDLKISHFPSARDTQSRPWYCAVSTACVREGLLHGDEWRLAVKKWCWKAERIHSWYHIDRCQYISNTCHTLALDGDRIDLVEVSSLQQPKLHQVILGELPISTQCPNSWQLSHESDFELSKRVATYTPSLQQQQLKCETDTKVAKKKHLNKGNLMEHVGQILGMTTYRKLKINGETLHTHHTSQLLVASGYFCKLMAPPA